MANTIDWGQGAVNNTNNWGKGKTNASNNWGTIYDSTAAGETNITGSGGVVPFTNTYSMSLDGIDEYFNCGYIAELNNASAFTFSGWYKQTTLDQERFLMGYFVDVNNWFGLYTWSNGNMYIHFKDVGLNKYGAFDYSTLVTANTWFNIVIVFNGSGSTNADRLKCFIDGTQVTLNFVGTQPTTTISGTNNLTLCKMDSFSQTFLGNADELALWNSDQSSNVSTIYNSGTPTDLTSLSPLSWWRMGDGDTWGGSSWTLTDNGSGGNDATSVNMEEADRLPISPNSYTQNSFSFDGIDEYFTAGNTLNLANDGTDAFSFSCWVKSTNLNTQILVGKQLNISPSNGYNFNISGGAIRFFLGTTTSNAYIFGTTANLGTLLDGNWHHLVLTYDGSQDISGFTIYYDNTTAPITTILNNTPNGVSNSAEFMLGARGTISSKGGFFDGNLDEVSYFNTELSASDVSTIFNNGVPTNISSLNPLGHWRMGENATWNGSTWTLTDQGSGGNNATSVNMEEADKTGDQAYVL